MAGYTVYHDAWGIGALTGAVLGWPTGLTAAGVTLAARHRLDTVHEQANGAELDAAIDDQEREC